MTHSTTGIDSARALPRGVATDWQFLWPWFGEREFCDQYWEKYVAVANCEVLGSGATDPEARDAAMRTLDSRGEKTIDRDRLIVDWVGAD
ncbi:MAG: hypothetical protein NT069_14830 [Planctomycetota bacterium]|nr:hypothetical protein [Planctomycetota bacterium]